MKKIILLCLLLIAAVLMDGDIFARRLNVRSFNVDPTDITARTKGRRDLNGVLCAVVRVDLPVEGCKFEGYVVESVYDTNGYLVYMTDGAQRLRLRCPGVETLDIIFAEVADVKAVESGMTYNLSLEGYQTPDANATQPTAPAGAYLTINVTPKTGFMLKINGNMVSTENGEYVKFHTPGKYDILVEATGYEPYSTQVVIDGSGNKNLDIKLESIMATLKMNIIPTQGSILKINGEIEPISNGRFEKSLLPGTYNVSIEAPGYDSYSEQIVLGKGETKNLDIRLESNMATLKISSTTPGTIIKIDGKQRGVDNAALSLSPGQYLVEAEKASHRGNSQVVALAAKETKTITLPELTPIYGAIDVNYRPTGATISIDGRQVGTTPDLISQVLIGSHEISVDKEGFEPFKTTVKVAEGETVALTGSLEEKSKEDLPEVTLADLKKKYEGAWAFTEGLAIVEKNGKYGYVDTTGQVVIPIKYDDAAPISEGLAKVNENGKYGFVDKTGQVVVPIKYDDAFLFSKGMAIVVQKDKWGFVDKTGKVVIPIKYDDAYAFNEGLAAVKLNDKWGFVDTTDTVVIPIKYDDVFSFRGGSARVKLNGQWGKIDKAGNFTPEK